MRRQPALTTTSAVGERVRVARADPRGLHPGAWRPGTVTDDHGGDPDTLWAVHLDDGYTVRTRTDPDHLWRYPTTTRAAVAQHKGGDAHAWGVCPGCGTAAGEQCYSLAWPRELRQRPRKINPCAGRPWTARTTTPEPTP